MTVELFFISVYKNGKICYVEEGPFIHPEDANRVIKNGDLPELSKPCKYIITVSELPITKWC